MMEKARVLPTNFVLKGTLETAVFFLTLYYAVPMGCAVFPQYGTIKVTEVEPEFLMKQGKDGKYLEEFMFNKGL